MGEPYLENRSQKTKINIVLLMFFSELKNNFKFTCIDFYKPVLINNK